MAVVLIGPPPCESDVCFTYHDYLSVGTNQNLRKLQFTPASDTMPITSPRAYYFTEEATNRWTHSEKHPRSDG